MNDDFLMAAPVVRPSTEELSLAAARCFRGRDGELLLRHLQNMTLHRSLGPDASDNLLRHLEGQRQLVTYINTLIQRGRNSQTPTAESGDMP